MNSFQETLKKPYEKNLAIIIILLIFASTKFHIITLIYIKFLNEKKNRCYCMYILK